LVVNPPALPYSSGYYLRLTGAALPPSLHDYLARALARVPGQSRRALALHLGLNQNAVYVWERGIAFPTDENMLALADLCEVPRAVALLHLAMWRTQGPARDTWAGVLHHVEKRAANK